MENIETKVTQCIKEYVMPLLNLAKKNSSVDYLREAGLMGLQIMRTLIEKEGCKQTPIYAKVETLTGEILSATAAISNGFLFGQHIPERIDKIINTYN